MSKEAWKQDASCLSYDVNIFFETYEENEQLRPAVEQLCGGCPVARECFAVGVSQKEYGVWGGVYLEHGKVSREFGKHKTKKQWAETWKRLTQNVH